MSSDQAKRDLRQQADARRRTDQVETPALVSFSGKGGVMHLCCQPRRRIGRRGRKVLILDTDLAFPTSIFCSA